MTNLKFYIVFLLVVFLFTILPFAQITQEHLFPEIEGLSLIPSEFDIPKNDGTIIDYRNEDERLLAIRIDYWENNAWAERDSSEYYYDNGLLIEQLDKTLVGGVWQNDRRVIYEYDANNNRTLLQLHNWDNVSWVTVYKNTYEYDINNNQILLERQNWSNGSWVNYSKTIYEYDENNNETLLIRQDGDGANWINVYQSIKEYDINNNKTSELEQQWEAVDWVNNWQTTYQYDANNNLLSSLEKNWNGTSWLNYEQSTYEYDVNNNPTSYLIERANGSSWENHAQTIYEHNTDNKLILRIRQSWASFEWMNISQLILERDANNNVTLYNIKKWENEAWVDDYYDVREYDAENNLISTIAQLWDGTELVNYDRYTFYYGSVTNVSQAELAHPVQIFPNPSSSGELTIDLGENEIPSGQINIYASTGQLIYAQPLQGEQRILLELNHFAVGTYCLQILNEEQQTTRTFIIAPKS